MSLDTKTARKIARLARIRVSDSEAEHYAGELSKILGLAEQLKQVNTDNVPLTSSVFASEMPMRKDEVTDGGNANAVTANATGAQYHCFAVPKVIE
jgi:aspartyl-tRNA(Asn)/glutamyl-tRNA(Gln) amidotransferase subunit C